jgi:hypothetical protein
MGRAESPNCVVAVRAGNAPRGDLGDRVDVGVVAGAEVEGGSCPYPDSGTCPSAWFGWCWERRGVGELRFEQYASLGWLRGLSAGLHAFSRALGYRW